MSPVTKTPCVFLSAYRGVPCWDNHDTIARLQITGLVVLLATQDAYSYRCCAFTLRYNIDGMHIIDAYPNIGLTLRKYGSICVCALFLLKRSKLAMRIRKRYHRCVLPDLYARSLLKSIIVHCRARAVLLRGTNHHAVDRRRAIQGDFRIVRPVFAYPARRYR